MTGNGKDKRPGAEIVPPFHAEINRAFDFAVCRVYAKVGRLVPVVPSNIFRYNAGGRAAWECAAWEWFSPKMKETSKQIQRYGVVGVVAECGRYLLIRRSPAVIAPGKLCFPGGGIEPGETPSQALVREFREELGVTARPVRLDWENVTPWGVHLQWWLAELEPNQTPIPNPGEVSEVLYLTLPDMLTHPDMLESNRPYLERLSATFQPLSNAARLS